MPSHKRVNSMKINNFFLGIWEAPQNALGKIMSGLWKKRLIVLNEKEKNYLYGLENLVSAIAGYKVRIYIADNKSHREDKLLKGISGFSMGRYICLNSAHDIQTIKHEVGHCWQSKKWGWLYLPVVGIKSSVFCNLWSRWFHTDKKGWNNYDRSYWHYVVNYYFEGQADKKGKVNRIHKLSKIARPSNSRYPAQENQRIAT